MTISVTGRPPHFDGLAWEYGPDRPDGRWTATAPCGCTTHGRTVLSGPLRGHQYGDKAYVVCETHRPPCPDCGDTRCRCGGGPGSD